METDDDYLFVYKAGQSERFGWVRFVYGNDGYDVISDYTINLEKTLKGVNVFAERMAFPSGNSLRVHYLDEFNQTKGV